MENWKGKSLYHYTTFEALEGILVNKEIWLGNLRYMNDRLEMKYLFNGLKQTIMDEVPEFSQNTIDLFDEQEKRFEHMTSFAFSLSKLPEDAAQWDRYSNKGHGVCIKFNAEKLNEKLNKDAILQPVFYSTSMRNHQIKGLIELFITDGIITNGFSDINGVFDNAWAMSAAYKHPSFKKEEEVRICSYPFFPKFFTGELKYKASPSGLREYLPIKLCSSVERNLGDVIEEITLGPNSGVDVNMFYRYLQVKGVDIKNISVSVSECPLR